MSPGTIPNGLLHALVFFLFVIAGSSYIVPAKLFALHAVLVTSIPVAIMIFYAAMIAFARLCRVLALGAPLSRTGEPSGGGFRDDKKIRKFARGALPLELNCRPIT